MRSQARESACGRHILDEWCPGRYSVDTQKRPRASSCAWPGNYSILRCGYTWGNHVSWKPSSHQDVGPRCDAFGRPEDLHAGLRPPDQLAVEEAAVVGLAAGEVGELVVVGPVPELALEVVRVVVACDVAASVVVVVVAHVVVAS